jgi:hypothetical protein
MTLSDLENAVDKLPPDKLARFRAWFETFDAARFDDKIERDAKAGKLDRLTELALTDFRQGRAASYEERRQTGVLGILCQASRNDPRLGR